MLEYLTVLMVIDLATQPYQKKAGCAINKAYSYLNRELSNDANITTNDEDCEAKGEGRMRLQLQFGKGKSGITEQAATQPLKNDDPPGVTLAQVQGGLSGIATAAQSGLPNFPKTLRKDLPDAIAKINKCASRFLPFGTFGWPKTICSATIGSSGWRIDLDQLNGTNLTQ